MLKVWDKSGNLYKCLLAVTTVWTVVFLSGGLQYYFAPHQVIQVMTSRASWNRTDAGAAILSICCQTSLLFSLLITAVFVVLDCCQRRQQRVPGVTTDL